MQTKHRIRTFSIVASFLLIFSLLTPGFAGAKGNSKHQLQESDSVAKAKVSDRLLEDFKQDDKVTFLIKFKEKTYTNQAAEEGKTKAAKGNLSSYKSELMQRSAVVSALKTTALESQQSVQAYLEKEVNNGNAENIRSYYIVNGMAVTATKEVAEKVAAFVEVEKILPNEKRQLFSTTAESTASKTDVADDVEWNVERVGAPEVWGMGIDGTGTVVASIDSGVQWDHPALKDKYRGYNTETGEVDHDYNWFDATEGESEPYDDIGHGTHVTGTMVGGEVDGSNQIGVAPGAKWISVKAFTEDGGTDDDLLAAAEWILAPIDAEGNTRVDMAPDVVNNSWGGGKGLDEWYRDVVKAWRASNIFPEFSAGNTDLHNPGGPGSIANPANYPESFATGATDMDDNLADFSLRGPSPYDEIKPDISAPGVSIRSAIPGDGYALNNGTSMAGPAVSALVALLRQADASLSVADLEEILLSTATAKTDDEYPESPNNGYGHGLVNAFDAVSFIMDGLGAIEGTVSKQGADNEEPTFEHVVPTATYVGMDTDLDIHAQDNTSVLTVTLNYQINNGEWQTMEATRTSGDYTDGEYEVTIPGEELEEGSLTYKWIINDYGNNEVVSEDYVVDVKKGITTGYFEDFETEPVGWHSFGENDSWEWGVPTSGPGNAASGEHVYATNLDGSYENDTNATLVMPAVDLPEGGAYLQFDWWYDLEEVHDYGWIYVSTDQEEWLSEKVAFYDSDGWESVEIDLSEYSGQRIYIGFNLESKVTDDVEKPGIYLDNVGISDTSQNNKLSLMNWNIKRDLLKEDKGLKTLKPSETEHSFSKEEKANPAALPLNAEVSILETGRSTKTDPADGTYALTSLVTGDYAVQADAYGFYSEQQNARVEEDETESLHFKLNEIPQGTVSGKITNEATGEPIEGATLFLMEDANVTPVESDENGKYNFTAYEGTYTLKTVAHGYHYQETEITIEQGQMEINMELEPFYSYRNDEISYDDGSMESAWAFYESGIGTAVKMSLPEDEQMAVVTGGVFQFEGPQYQEPDGGAFAVEVWDSSGVDGMPGKKLAGPIEAEAIRDPDIWTVIDLNDENIIVDDDFYMVYVQTEENNYAPLLGIDRDEPYAGRSYQVESGVWTQIPADEGNYMIRARVSYEVDEPVITSPTDGSITNEADIILEGTASPETTVKLMNNGEEADSAEVDENGEFAIPTELTEGENEFLAMTIVGGKETKESEPVKVTLDTKSPNLIIDNPLDGDKTNRETVTVEGTVDDANLDFVKVNGQQADVTDDGHYSKRILLDNGENEIEVIAVDAAGNESTKSVTLKVKYNAPVIENVTPTEDVYLETGKSVKIEFDSEPGLRATFVIHMPLTNMGGKIANATELPMMETTDGHYVGYWTVPSGTVADGAVVEVKGTDSYGNETRAAAEGMLMINVEDDNGSNGNNGN